MSSFGISAARGDEIVRKRAGQKAAVLGIGEFFIQGRADCRREGAVDLTVRQARVEDRSAIMTGDVFVDSDFTGLASISMPQKSKPKP